MKGVRAICCSDIYTARLTREHNNANVLALGSMVVGVVMEVSTLWIPTEFKTVTALAILIVILVVRPQGILGQAERVG